MALMIMAIITGGISAGCFIYAWSAFHERGPILMNGYVLATTEEKRKLARISPEQKRKDYHYAATVFVGLSAIFFVLFLEFLFLIFDIQASAVFISIILLLTVVLITYVIVTQIRDGRFKE